jgi:hypothetical protein
VRVDEFNGTDGQHDVFVFNAGPDLVNIDLLRNFEPGEDFLLYQNMDNRTLIVGDLRQTGSGEGIGFNTVIFTGESGANILVFSVPYQQDLIEQMIVPFGRPIVYDDPFLI